MKEGPSEPACRSRLQTAVSCCRPTAVVVNVTEKAWVNYVMCGLERRTQVNHWWGIETDLPMASKPEHPRSPGRAWRKPVYWPCDVRCTSGVTLALALVWNLRTCSAVIRKKAQAAAPQGWKYRYAGQGRTVP